MTHGMTIIFGIFLVKVKLVMLYCHAIFWGGRGTEGGVHENIANNYCFLLRMANLLIFIDNGGI